MKQDIKSIILLLTTQCMINLGVIEDPIKKTKNINIEGAELFVGLLEVLEEKTKGNLTQMEEAYLQEVLENLRKIFQKQKQGHQ